MLAFHDYVQFERNKAFVQFAIMAQLGYEIAQSNAACLLDKGIFAFLFVFYYIII